MTTTSAQFDDPGQHGLDVRMTGASVALVIAGTVALVAAMMAAPVLFVGVPAAGLAGWILGPRVERAGTAEVGAAMGAATVVIADTLVVGGAAMASGSTNWDLVGRVGGGVAIWAIGLGIVGLPMLAITIPCGIVWAFGVRRVARSMR